MSQPSLAARKFICRLLVGMLFFICVAGHSQTLLGQTREILLGIEPEHNIFDQVERYRILAGYLSSQLGVQVNLTIMSRYGEMIKRFRTKRLDGAFLSSYTATTGFRELNLEPVASPVNLNGESTSQGYIFVRKDSGIHSVEDMKGKRIVFVDPATTEGYLFPLAYLHQHGVNDINSFFNENFYFSGSHVSAILAVLDGRADIGAAKSTSFQKLVRTDPFINQELLIIAQSENVPEVTLCIKSDLDEGLRQKMRNVLLQMDKNGEGRKVLKEFGALRFIKSEKSDFAVVDKLSREAMASIMEHGND